MANLQYLTSKSNRFVLPLPSTFKVVVGIRACQILYKGEGNTTQQYKAIFNPIPDSGSTLADGRWMCSS
jgi:hypothetical protein